MSAAHPRIRRAIFIVVVLAMAAALPGLTGGPAEATAELEGTDSVGFFDRSTARWHFWDPIEGFESFVFGNPDDVPLVGNWDCTGAETVGVYRPSETRVYLTEEDLGGEEPGKVFGSFALGNPGDIPLVGDFTGSQCDTVSLYRPSTGEVFIFTAIRTDGGGLGAADFSYLAGAPGEVPFSLNFGTESTIGFHNPATGRVHYRHTLDAGPPDVDFIYGNPGDKIVLGDWRGDFGPDTVGVFQAAQAEFHLRYSNTPGRSDQVVSFADADRRLFERHLATLGSSSTLLDDLVVPVAGRRGANQETTFAALPCAPSGGFVADGPVGSAPAPSEASNAVGVYAMTFSGSRRCERAVITLGTAPGPVFFAQQGTPANTVPEGTVVEAIGNRINVSIPGVGVGRNGHLDQLYGPNAAFVVSAPFPSSGVYVDLLFFNNRRATVTFLDSPARIVVDTKDAPTGTGLAIGPVISPFAVIRDNLDPDLAGPGIAAPIEVVGYGRFFEAFGTIRLREVAAVPGTGAAATATFSGGFPAVFTGSEYGVGASSDGTTTWGEYTFTIDAIAPGSYELFVGEDGMEPPFGEFGVYDQFTVVP